MCGTFSGPIRFEFPQPKNCPAIALSPDGKQLVVAVDYAAKVYDIDKRQERFELKGHKGQVSAVAFSPDGETIATGSWDETVKLWDAATGRERATFKWPIGRVYSLVFAPDGLRLAAGGDRGAWWCGMWSNGKVKVSQGVKGSVCDASKESKESRSQGVSHIPAKFRSICRPTRWLFSGWNCVAKTLSRQIAAANGCG